MSLSKEDSLFPFNDLSDDLQIVVFAFCSIKQLGLLARVSKKFKRLSENDKLWERIYHIELHKNQIKESDKMYFPPDELSSVTTLLQNLNQHKNPNHLVKGESENWKKFYFRWMRHTSHPPKILDHVFSFLKTSELANVASVCHNWEERVNPDEPASDAEVWGTRCQTEFGVSKPFPQTSWKETYQILTTSSSEDLSRPSKMQKNSNTQQLYNDQDVDKLVDMLGVTRENAISLLMQANGNVNKVLEFMFG